MFFTTRSDGILDVWDVLQQQKQASLGVKVCDEPLRCIRTHEMGRLVAVGNQKGTSYLVEFSENLSSSNKNDKMLLTAVSINFLGRGPLWAPRFGRFPDVREGNEERKDLGSA